MNFLTYQKFNENEKVKTNKLVREFTLTHLNDSLFKVKSDDFQREFSVEPYDKSLSLNLREVYHDLLDSISTESVSEIYSEIKQAEKIKYNFGDIFSSDFSLVSIPGLDIHLTDKQQEILKSSEENFLKNEFPKLPKSVKNDIIDELMDRGEIICVVIEALFYYLRKNNNDDFYNGQTSEEIIEDYEAVIKTSSKELTFSFDGPSSSPDTISEISPDDDKSYWLCEKNLKKFVIFGTSSIEELHSEDGVNGTIGLKLSLSSDSKDESKFHYFNLIDLSSKIQEFFKDEK